MNGQRPPAPGILDQLKSACGQGGWTDDQEKIAPWLVEWRDRWRGATPLMLMPADTATVSAIVRICAATRTPLVPQGGNTGLVGGQIPAPDGSSILLSLRRMNRIRDVDERGATLTAEAGTILTDVQRAAEAVDRLFPLSLASEGSATIGGLASTNAGGTAVLAYGNMRDLVLGLEAVLPDGQVWNGLSGLRKDNTGYDLRNLLIGAEGTLGIITAATLKLFPRPARVETAIAALGSVEDAVGLLAFARSRAPITAFELMPRIGLDFVLRHVPGTRDPLQQPAPWYVLVEASLPSDGLAGTLQDTLGEAARAGLISDAAIAQSAGQAALFWKMREAMSAAQKPEGGSIKHDVSVPVSAIPRFIAQASSTVVARFPGARPVPFGHIGDGNIHFNVSQPPGMAPQEFLACTDDMNTIVHDIVHACAGSISAEHGIGQAKRGELQRYKPAAALDAMRRIRQALDPLGIMNPGKLLP